MPASVALTIARMSSVSVGAFWSAAVPLVRRMPFIVLTTIGLCVGDSSPTALWASAIALSLR
jgi:hypothetical protein